MTVKDFRPGLRAFLLADNVISGLVGGTRVYPVKMPQGIMLSSIVYNEISASGDHHMQGASGLASPRIQIAAWAKTADEANTLARVIKDRLDGYKGSMGSGAALITVQGIFFDTWRDQYDDSVQLNGKVSDYFVWFNEQ